MNPRLTRQELLRRGAAGGALLAFPSLLAACGGGDGGGSSDGGELKTVLNFANWPAYIDVEKPTTLQQFTQETGIKVNYFEEINDNAEYFAKVQGPLSQGQGIDRDIFVFTDNSRFPGILVNEGWVQKLDKDLIPNIENLVDAQASPPFDPNREYSLPWQGGMTGIAWNEDLTGPVESIEQLLEDPKLKGKVSMLQEMADSVGVVMLGNGDDPGAVTDEAFNAAIERVQAAVDSGQIIRFTGNDYMQPLTRGTFAASVSWSGDIVQLLPDNPNLKWAIPRDGGMIWTDNMFIPTGGSVPTASTYINSVYDPAVAAKIAAYINYVTPVKGAKEELAKTDPELANNQLIFPNDETLAQVKQFDSVALDNEEYITLWQGVLGQ
ncbi:MAG TPA: spermidine/putrescine ABC transporter substrate-binding protein [Gaiellaceae bacterium]|nr:spermidine/putrescine ABC transporter substrate-binding protein [Gaiellaceae bacterium]